MTDAHCHMTGGDLGVREFLIGRDFVGVHPWDAEGLGGLESLESLGGLGGLEGWLRARLENLPNSAAPNLSNSAAPNLPNSAAPNLPNSAAPNLPNLLLGIGEIGLDRLKVKTISPRMREVFEEQLKLALEFHRPVVLHGAKCWGQVVAAISSTIRRFDDSTIPSFLFHGFSRSDGLLPDIVALNGYVSVGPAVLNDHAVNYRELVKKIPADRLLVETDRTPENAATCPSVFAVAAKVAELRGIGLEELEKLTDANATRFIGG